MCEGSQRNGSERNRKLTFSFTYNPFNEDVLVVGRGGCGKTYLVKNLFLKAFAGRSARVPFWLWDHRWQYLLDGIETVYKVEDLKAGSQILQPFNKSIADFDHFCEKALYLSNSVIAVEETHNFTSKQKIKSDNFAEIINAGRPRGLDWICVTRRPQQLHNDILSDADHIFCFDMELPSDVKFMRQWIGTEVELLLEPRLRKENKSGSPKLAAHHFVYKDVTRGIIEVGKL